MALSIRLSRGGSKKRPYYRIVVADARSPRDGKFIEKIGNYNPLLKKDDEKRVVLNADRAKHWSARSRPIALLASSTPLACVSALRAATRRRPSRARRPRSAPRSVPRS